MKLPDRFQFRVSGHEGYTHVAKRLVSGGYKIQWARDWYKVVKYIDWDICDDEEIDDWTSGGGWIVVDFEQKKQEEALPDVFYIRTRGGEYTFTKECESVWRCSTIENHLTAAWDKANILRNLKGGVWKLLDKKPLTAEQQRANKEIREQISQLESSIRISEQNVEHQNRLQANYRERIEQLQQKIVEGE